jgi:hypothetical protein
MRPPIKLCVNGHKICENCRVIVHQCPTCGQGLIHERNLGLEDLARRVKYPCKYRSYGCTEMFDHDEIEGHQMNCLHIPQKCPVAKLAFGFCSWTGNYSDIKGHVKENHPELCCEYVEGDFKCLYSLTNDMKVFCFIFAYNEIFFSSFQAKDGNFYAFLLYVGPAGNASKYKYKVEFVNKDNTQSVTVMHMTRHYGVDLDKLYRWSDCGKLHYDVGNRLGYGGCVRIKLEITLTNL